VVGAADAAGTGAPAARHGAAEPASFRSGPARPAGAGRRSGGPDDADTLLLRRAIALHALGDPQAAVAAVTLQERLDAAKLRGENLHAREEARLALDLPLASSSPAGACIAPRAAWSTLAFHRSRRHLNRPARSR
jgi:hypothetical protein